MKNLFLKLLFSFFTFTFFSFTLFAQTESSTSSTPSPSPTPTPTFVPTSTAPAKAPAPPTIVTSDEFKLDMQIKEGIFTGNVVVNGTDFKMTSHEMYVYFDDKNQIKRLIGKGDVLIDQPDRHTKSNKADYFAEDNKIILTEMPQVIQNHNVVTGNVITIYRGNNRMDVDGRSRVLIYQDATPSPSKTPGAAPSPTPTPTP